MRLGNVTHLHGRSLHCLGQLYLVSSRSDTYSAVFDLQIDALTQIHAVDYIRDHFRSNQLSPASVQVSSCEDSSENHIWTDTKGQILTATLSVGEAQTTEGKVTSAECARLILSGERQ